MNRGMIADIQRASVHDGPGLRTTVFFKGCPLHCEWCHNPECISFEQQILYYPEKCIHCGRCSEGCYTGAKVICGREYTVEELMAELLQDKEYYTNGGGVTFSGGEPLAQKAFLSEVIDACKAQDIHCAIETSLIYYDEAVLKKLDLVMADLKIWDDALHRQYTGVSNEKIKENFRRLGALGVPVTARTPVIPGIRQGIEQNAAFLKGLKHVEKYELLPYHPLGESKRQAMGLNRTGFQQPTKEYMKQLEAYTF